MLVPLFALLWFGISAMLALLSGWSSLASQFRADSAVQGDQFRFVSASMGAASLPVNYGNSLRVSINEQGFRLTVLFMFRFLSPPLFIPWVQVESVSDKRLLFMRCAAIRIRGHWPTISLYGKAGRRLLEVYERVSGKTALP